jgi:hypothetical protein
MQSLLKNAQEEYRDRLPSRLLPRVLSGVLPQILGDALFPSVYMHPGYAPGLPARRPGGQAAWARISRAVSAALAASGA